MMIIRLVFQTILFAVSDGLGEGSTYDKKSPP